MRVSSIRLKDIMISSPEIKNMERYKTKANFSFGITASNLDNKLDKSLRSGIIKDVDDWLIPTSREQQMRLETMNDLNKVRRGLELAREFHERLCTIDCSEITHLWQCEKGMEEIETAEDALEFLEGEM